MRKMLALVLIISAGGFCADTQPPPKEISEYKIDSAGTFTASKPDISISNLESLLKPLRKTQLEKEAEGWMEILQNNVQQISAAEISDAPPEEISKLHEQRTDIIDRLLRVLEELEQKGGDIEEYKKYISAVSKANVDVSDVNGTSKCLLTG
ncbi:hypothetical protein L21SP3_00514 [Sedimentisphaera cyanobacteriorum]|uniref:Secreted protein n=2 Tax=Sedimentisphaera cyanobacteriorum TaxID=1940790 RepID=A0A1Q2HN93_9BACT|nr:hypothetical protein L21SP3_00514 [Sedimentisphaera cyanobacteriorum]